MRAGEIALVAILAFIPLGVAIIANTLHALARGADAQLGGGGG